jgi:hypothetical protein
MEPRELSCALTLQGVKVGKPDSTEPRAQRRAYRVDVTRSSATKSSVDEETRRGSALSVLSNRAGVLRRRVSLTRPQGQV